MKSKKSKNKGWGRPPSGTEAVVGARVGTGPLCLTPAPPETVPVDLLAPARINDQIYKPVDTDDPTIRELADSVSRHGLLTAIGVTQDDVILSGHRRFAACQVAGLTMVRVERYPIRSTDPNFPEVLVEFNRTRDKTPEERFREEAVRTDPADAAAQMAARRNERLARLVAGADDGGLASIDYVPARRRKKISEGKLEMLIAAKAILIANRVRWPLTVRTIHYRMAQSNPPPLRNTHPRYDTGPYRNDDDSYGDLSDLLCRGRIAGLVEWESIVDETRPVSVWRKWPEVGAYVREQFDGFLATYRRDLLQSQTEHIELVCEKMTVQGIADRVAHPLCVNTMIGRGFSSVTARYELAQRFVRSGKERLLLLVVSDHDPEGECIATNLVASLTDEFGIDKPIEARRVALTRDQVDRFGLLPAGKVKRKSSRAPAFVRKFGDNVYELEALEPAELEDLIRDALLAVIDHDLLKREQELEKVELATLYAKRQFATKQLGVIDG